MALLEMRLMRNRYRLTRAHLAEKGRLDRVGLQMLDGALDHALSSLRLELAGEVCIRNLDVPVRVRLSAGDSDIAAAWSRAIVESIAASLERRSDDVVVYSSRRHALLDVAVGVSRRDTARAWAWSQLELWGAPAGVADATAVEELVRTLEAERGDTVAVLGALGRLGLLGRLAARLATRQVERLAIAAALAAGLEVADMAPPRFRSDELADATHRIGLAPRAVGRGSSADLVTSLTRRSAIFAALAGATETHPDADLLHWLSVLVALEADPGTAVRNAPAASVLMSAIARLLAADSPATTTRSDAEELRAAIQSTETADDPVAPSIVSPAEPEHAHSREREPGSPDDPSSERRGVELRAATDAGIPSDSTLEQPSSRRRAVTDAGGLLFLVHLVDRLRLPERLTAMAELETRSLRWTLHRLAMRLGGLAEDDPAALAFCGLGPDATPPSEDEPPPTEAELALIQVVKSELAATLAESLERREEPVAVVLAEVCMRRAEIVADLAWIDVLLALDDVSVEVRRAGLDIDPGWVPWLGVALRFVYG